MLVVWLFTGIWHGAEWTFLVWGLLNYAALVFERFTDFEKRQGHNVLKWVYTMFLVNLGWVIFRAENLVYAENFIKCMFGFGGAGIWSDHTWMYLKEYGIFFLAGAIFCLPIGRRMNYLIVKDKVSHRLMDVLYPVLMMGVFLICITYLVKGSYNPFIYFNF